MATLEPQDKRIIIARRAARELQDGYVVNLGIGLPTLVANYVPEGIKVWLHSENGFVGLGPAPAPGEEDPDVVNAGAQPASIIPGGACFDSCMSFAIIRGGHLDLTILGALEVDEKGNLANWMVPGRIVPGMGGAMDLVVGARRVIIATEHTLKDGSPKIVRRCQLPLTAAGEVDLIITELAVIEVTREGLLLKEVAPGVTPREVQARTGASLIIPDTVATMEI
ncbi:3-oxoacid CoA-transferase subunit B [Moorella sulfitireducens (nom. illeg.)]|uniref:3-oxoacid CoA-transferase subunit B n=1 Tax=Neomoorella sulfitireducens TaxID=2972948 RepID=UPI0021ACE304|nr:3-oxoacid CoA-transferase subunit B [Moorella sulfitireducens]